MVQIIGWPVESTVPSLSGLMLLMGCLSTAFSPTCAAMRSQLSLDDQRSVETCFHLVSWCTLWSTHTYDDTETIVLLLCDSYLDRSPLAKQNQFFLTLFAKDFGGDNGVRVAPSAVYTKRIVARILDLSSPAANDDVVAWYHYQRDGKINLIWA